MMGDFSLSDVWNSPFGKTAALSDVVRIVLEGGLALAGIILIIYIIMGGYATISGAGEGNPQKAAQGKQTITIALIGFAVVFVAYWIVRIIELVVGVPFITNSGL